jgi:hypothetical protein
MVSSQVVFYAGWLLLDKLTLQGVRYIHDGTSRNVFDPLPIVFRRQNLKSGDGLRKQE